MLAEVVGVLAVEAAQLLVAGAVQTPERVVAEERQVPVQRQRHALAVEAASLELAQV